MSLTYFIILIYIIFIFVEFFIISLKITGLSREKARFQVISLLTSTGFTTKESELITQHPIRRKIAERIMVFKYIASIIGTATLFNAYVNVFVNKINLRDLLIWITLLSIIFAIIKNNWIISKLDYLFENQLLWQSNKYKMKFDSQNLWTREDFGIIDIVLEEDNFLIGTKLKDSQLKANFMQVLQIDKGNKFHPFPKPDYIFETGDKLTVYGNLNKIKETI